MKFQINKEQIQQYFHLPLEEAAIKLGCCSSVLKRTCRQLGIKRWPYRRMKSLSKRQNQLQQQLTTLHDQYMKSRKQLEDVEGEMDVIIKEELSGIAEGATVIIDDANIDVDPTLDYDQNDIININTASSSTGNPTTFNFNNNFEIMLIPSSSTSSTSSPPSSSTLASSSSVSSLPNHHVHTSSSYVSPQQQQPSKPVISPSQQHVIRDVELNMQHNNNSNMDMMMPIHNASSNSFTAPSTSFNNNLHRTMCESNNGDPISMTTNMHISPQQQQVGHQQHANNLCNTSLHESFDHAFGNVVNNNQFMQSSHVDANKHSCNGISNTASSSSSGWNNEKSELDTSQYNNLDNEHSFDASVHESINTADYTTRGRGGYSFPNHKHDSSRSPSSNYAMQHVEPCFRPLISTLDGVNVNAALTNDRGVLMWFSKGLMETLPSYFNTKAVNKDYTKDDTFKGSTIDVYESFYRRRATHGTIRMIQCFFERYVVVDSHGVMLDHYSAHPSAGSHYMWYLHVRKETDFSLISSYFNPSDRNKALQFGVPYTFELEDDNK
ncbi:predicted protein [Naegleria gruberi]|uniref:Predicted protein n=1 Tax=Naegleria gruberi TaxID=5762 RepID=D2VXR5_NAEGR|nr:uncharacterized protein NAEGRDRAFT_59526 [Naegleria gruberi]EFC38340.1 predicted protein [Naegleria gruberi]|eukprot:XP_002671084.1 predicted protein [Naegleria gruberi strain NEG-M]